MGGESDPDSVALPRKSPLTFPETLVTLANHEQTCRDALTLERFSER